MADTSTIVSKPYWSALATVPDITTVKAVLYDGTLVLPADDLGFLGDYTSSIVDVTADTQTGLTWNADDAQLEGDDLSFNVDVDATVAGVLLYDDDPALDDDKPIILAVQFSVAEVLNGDPAPVVMPLEWPNGVLARANAGDYVETAEKGVPLGVAELDADGLVPADQLPAGTGSFTVAGVAEDAGDVPEDDLRDALGARRVHAVDTILATTAVDGTATSFTVLAPAPGATGSGVVPDGFVGTITIGSQAAFEAMLAGAFPSGARVAIPGGADAGVYLVTDAMIAADDPWTEIASAVGDWVVRPGEGDGWLAEVRSGQIDTLSTNTFAEAVGLLADKSTMFLAVKAIEGILDRKRWVPAAEDDVAFDPAPYIDTPTAVQPTLTYGTVTVGADVFVTGNVDPADDRLYHVESDGAWTELVAPDVLVAVGNGGEVHLNDPGTADHGTFWRWFDDDVTVRQRGGGSEVDSGEGVGSWVKFTPGGSGGGSGDLVSTNNLSDVANAATARTNLGLAIGTNVQAFDADLSAVAALTPSNDDLLQRKAGAWTNRTPAQVKTDLAIAAGDVSGLGSLATLSAVDSAHITDGTIVAGDLAAALASRIPTTVQITDTASVTSSTTLANVTPATGPNLAFAVTSGTTYFIEACLYVSGDTAGDVKVGLTHPGGTVKVAGFGLSHSASAVPGGTNTDAIISSSGGSVGLGVLTGSVTPVLLRGYYACTSNGTLQIQHAQRTSSGTATVVEAGSFLRYHT